MIMINQHDDFTYIYILKSYNTKEFILYLVIVVDFFFSISRKIFYNITITLKSKKQKKKHQANNILYNVF